MQVWFMTVTETTFWSPSTLTLLVSLAVKKQIKTVRSVDKSCSCPSFSWVGRKVWSKLWLYMKHGDLKMKRDSFIHHTHANHDPSDLSHFVSQTCFASDLCVFFGEKAKQKPARNSGKRKWAAKNSSKILRSAHDFWRDPNGPKRGFSASG